MGWIQLNNKPQWHDSAMWMRKDLPGLIFYCPERKGGWRIKCITTLVRGSGADRISKQMRGQRFSSRQEALQAVQACRDFLPPLLGNE